MRLRITTSRRVLHDLRVPKDQRDHLSKAIEEIERRRNDYEFHPTELSIGEVNVSGVVESITHAKENGEEIIVIQFLEN